MEQGNNPVGVPANCCTGRSLPRKLAVQIGFPIMIKATAGGGGRGMRLAMEEGEFMRLLQQAQQEADAAFGNPDMYLERYVKNPRHIEFQVLCCSGVMATIVHAC